MYKMRFRTVLEKCDTDKDMKIFEVKCKTDVKKSS